MFGRLGMPGLARIPVPTSLSFKALCTLGYSIHHVRKESLAILRVLLIDGDPVRAALVAAGLSANACSVVGVLPDHADLVNQVRAARADVIVCDIDNPSRDAIESMRALNRDEPRPVVMFVDQSSADTIADAMAAGVAAYVIEGLAPHRVKPVIDVAIARFRAHQALHLALHDAQSALRDRKLVDRAKRILMQTRQLSEDQAYRALQTQAMKQGRRLADIACAVIETNDLPLK